MKKILLSLITIIMLGACSGDDSAPANLTIDNVAFIPTTAKRYIGDALEQVSIRRFTMTDKSQSLTVSFSVPVGAAEAGEYSLGFGNSDMRQASGIYVNGSGQYTLTGTGVVLQELGNNKYKITIIDSYLTHTVNSQNKTIHGSFEGTFTTVEN